MSHSTRFQEFPGSKAKDLQFLVGGEEFVEFHEGLLGMAAGDQKNVDIILSDNYADNKGKKANFNIQLNGIDLQKNVWNQSGDLETHTVETHIYRLRKKIFEKFKDNNFIHSTKKGYKI